MGSWNDKYSVNIEFIDVQHKELFNILDTCYELLLQSKDKDNYDDIMHVIENLKEYAIYHFNAEEEFMEKNNYSKLLSHKFAHVAFMEKINSFDSYSIDRYPTQYLKEILEFVSSWIKNHILDTDKNIPKYIK